jgi:diguanylate cyclase (GGDEF)-like protein
MPMIPLPPEAQARIAALIGLNVLETPAEDRFDRITRIAVRLFKVPVSLINMVDRDRQWTKSAFRQDVVELERSDAFCACAIREQDVMVVPNALKDIRFSDNPLVTREPYIRFYAGCPLSAPDGHKIGTLCLIDHRPRDLNEMDRAVLRDLAHIVENELAVNRLGDVQARLIAERDEMERKSMVDGATRLWNRRSILEVFDRELRRIRRTRGMVGVVLAEVDGFDRFMGGRGEASGIDVLQDVARQLRLWTRPYDAIGRFGRETFLLVLPGCEAEAAASKGETIRRAVCALTVNGAETKPDRITLSVGVTDGRGRMRALVRGAEMALRRAKRAGGNRVAIA